MGSFPDKHLFVDGTCCLLFKELFHAFCYQRAKMFLALVAFQKQWSSFVI